jgi:hypothetical protein
MIGVCLSCLTLICIINIYINLSWYLKFYNDKKKKKIMIKNKNKEKKI